MKRLRKFNESNNVEQKLEYIKSCFINLLEDNKDNTEQLSQDVNGIYELTFPTITGTKFAFIESYPYDDFLDLMIKNSEEATEILKEIQVCIKKVQIEYPQLRPKIFFMYNDLRVSYKIIDSIFVDYKID